MILHILILDFRLFKNLNVCFLYTFRIYFTPNQPVLGLSLVGLPGTKGRLSIVVESEIAEKNIELLIPFQLAQCPLGYYDPPGASTVDEVKDSTTVLYHL